MKLGKLFYAKDRKAWRAWLKKNHKAASEIWLVYYKKSSGKKRIPYNDSVEEALCYGWIDSTMKNVDDISFAQRFTPRRKNSPLSELNKERIRRLIKSRKMTKAGLESIKHHFDRNVSDKQLKKFVMPRDILKELKSNPAVWKNFQKFPKHYRQIRISWIDSSRKRPDEFKKRLRYFMNVTAKNKKFGMIQ